MKRKLLTLKGCNEIYGLSQDFLLNYEKQGQDPWRCPQDIERLLGLP